MLNENGDVAQHTSRRCCGNEAMVSAIVWHNPNWWAQNFFWMVTKDRLGWLAKLHAKIFCRLPGHQRGCFDFACFDAVPHSRWTLWWLGPNSSFGLRKGVAATNGFSADFHLLGGMSPIYDLMNHGLSAGGFPALPSGSYLKYRNI